MNLSLILFNTSRGVYSIPKTKCAPLFCFSSKFLIYAPSFLLLKLSLRKRSLNLSSWLKYLVISILLKEWSRTKHFYPYDTYYYILFQLSWLLFQLTHLLVFKHLKFLKAYQEIIQIVWCFTVSLTPSINTFEFPSDFMILLISSISSFQMTKVIPFSALTTPRLRIFLWIASSIAEADAIAANGAKRFLAKRTATFINGPANLPDKAPRSPPDWMILDNCALLSFILVEILLAKAFLILVFYLFVRKSSCANSSSRKPFLVILNGTSVLFCFFCCRLEIF